MGTDIHLYVERRVDGGWVSCDSWEPGKYEPGNVTVPYKKHFYSGRNYDVFAILADVRNGHGFAGVDTGDGFVPIAPPRGLPPDLSSELAREAAAYLDHTPSYLLLSELMAYDWTQTTTKRGWVSGTEYAEWSQWARKYGEGPRSYCGGVSGRDIEHISEEEMAKKIAKIGHDDYSSLKNTYCQVSWSIPYYKAAGNFISEVIPRLWRLGKPEDVRIVFWFDS